MVALNFCPMCVDQIKFSNVVSPIARTVGGRV